MWRTTESFCNPLRCICSHVAADRAGCCSLSTSASFQSRQVPELCSCCGAMHGWAYHITATCVRAVFDPIHQEAYGLCFTGRKSGYVHDSGRILWFHACNGATPASCADVLRAIYTAGSSQRQNTACTSWAVPKHRASTRTPPTGTLPSGVLPLLHIRRSCCQWASVVCRAVAPTAHAMGVGGRGACMAGGGGGVWEFFGSEADQILTYCTMR